MKKQNSKNNYSKSVNFNNDSTDKLNHSLPLKNLNRKPRILWANPFCILDTSSGASISVRQILLQLLKNSFDIDIVGATNFDDEKGISRIQDQWDSIKKNQSDIINIKDNGLVHRLLKTNSFKRNQMTVTESDRFYKLYISRLEEFKPDLVFFYGGQTLDYLISYEARIRKIPSAAYLVNGNYLATRWCQDVDLIITDTYATANFYKEKIGFNPIPVGKFIDQASIIAKKHERKHITLINPSWSKGAGIVAMIAAFLEKKRPDIIFEIVESRGNWSDIVEKVTTQVFNAPKQQLDNVIVSPNTSNIAEVYERSRIILGLSQWWESGSRVLAEAMLNGIPAIVSNYGGSPEMVGEGGIVFDLPSKCHEPPFNTLPSLYNIHPLISLVEKIWDDEPFYLSLVTKSLKQGFDLHQIDRSTRRIIDAFMPFINLKAGDQDFDKIIRNYHKHKLLVHNLKLNIDKYDNTAGEDNSIKNSKITPSLVKSGNFDFFKKSKKSKVVGFLLFGNSDCASSRLHGYKINSWLNNNSNYKSVILHEPKIKYQSDISDQDINRILQSVISNKCSTVIFQKTSGRNYLILRNLLSELGVTTIFVDCDLRSNYKELEEFDSIIVPTDQLAKKYKERGFKSISVISDTIDFEDKIDVDETFPRQNGIWIGTSDKFEYFDNIRSRIQQVDPSIAIDAISDHPNADIIWQQDLFPEIFHRYKFGFITLEENTWGEVKSPNRAILMMANGLPTFAPTGKVYSDIISHSQNGFFYEKEKDFIDELKILDDNARWKEISSKAVNSVISKFSIHTIGHLWIDVLETLKTKSRDVA